MGIVNLAKFPADFQPGFRNCVIFYNTDPDQTEKGSNQICLIKKIINGNQLTTLLINRIANFYIIPW